MQTAPTSNSSMSHCCSIESEHADAHGAVTHLECGECPKRRLRDMKGCEHDKKQEPIYDSSEGGGSSDKGPGSARQFERDIEGGTQGGGEEGEKRATATAGGAGERLQAVGADETRELVM
jgi:hypothetical protein